MDFREPCTACRNPVTFPVRALDRADEQLAADGFPVTDDLLARLSPLQFDHINFLGRYVFFRPAEAGRRPLRQPSVGDDESGRCSARMAARSAVRKPFAVPGALSRD